MSERSLDTAAVIAPPPLIYVSILIVGVLLNFVLPYLILPGALNLISGLPLIAIGFVLVVSAVWVMHRANTSPDPSEPVRAIVTVGPFQYVRNPIYLGFTLIYLGIGIALNAWLVLLLLPLALITIHFGVIAREEKYLERRFGNEYLQYKARVRRWI